MHKKIFYIAIFFSIHNYTSHHNFSTDNKNNSQPNSPIFFYSLPTSNQLTTHNLLHAPEHTSRLDKDLFDRTATTLALISLELEISVLEKARRRTLVAEKNEKFLEELNDTLDTLCANLNENNNQIFKLEHNLTAKRIAENKKIIDDIHLILSRLKLNNDNNSAAADIPLNLSIKKNTKSFEANLNKLLSELQSKKETIEQEISDIQNILNALKK